MLMRPSVRSRTRSDQITAPWPHGEGGAHHDGQLVFGLVVPGLGRRHAQRESGARAAPTMLRNFIGCLLVSCSVALENGGRAFGFCPFPVFINIPAGAAATSASCGKISTGHQHQEHAAQQPDHPAHGGLHRHARDAAGNHQVDRQGRRELAQATFSVRMTPNQTGSQPRHWRSA